MKNHYQALGLKIGASEAEITSAFRSLSKIYHPDVGGNSELFISIMESYTYLKNENNREQFEKLFKEKMETESDDGNNLVSSPKDKAIHNNPPSKNPGLLILIIVLIIVILFFIFLNNKKETQTTTSTTFNQDETSKNEQELVQEDIELVNIKLLKTEIGTDLVGIVRNNSKTKIYEFLELNFNLYDKDGNIIASLKVRIPEFEREELHLLPSETVKFTRSTGYIEAVSIKLVSIKDK